MITDTRSNKTTTLISPFFFSLEDVKVYFHRSDQFLDLSGRMGYKIYKGETVQSQVSWHDVRWVWFWIRNDLVSNFPGIFFLCTTRIWILAWAGLAKVRSCYLVSIPSNPADQFFLITIKNNNKISKKWDCWVCQILQFTSKRQF